MQMVNEALNLLKRQAELESGMRRPGGIRILEERELHRVRQSLQRVPEATDAVLQAARALGCPLSSVTERDVEYWSRSSPAQRGARPPSAMHA
jgi:hypothetical protein